MVARYDPTAYRTPERGLPTTTRYSTVSRSLESDILRREAGYSPGSSYGLTPTSSARRSATPSGDRGLQSDRGDRAFFVPPYSGSSATPTRDTSWDAPRLGSVFRPTSQPMMGSPAVHRDRATTPTASTRRLEHEQRVEAHNSLRSYFTSPYERQAIGARTPPSSGWVPTTPSSTTPTARRLDDHYDVARSVPRPMRRGVPDMVKDPITTFLPPQNPEDFGKLVVVLDLDETLVFARNGPVMRRPGLAELLASLHGICEVLIWTAGEKDYAQSVIREIDPSGTIEHCIYRHPKWWTGRPGYTKNLSALGRPLDRVIMLENTPDCCKAQPSNSLLVSDYLGAHHNPHDDILFHVSSLLRSLVASPMPVQDFMETSPHVARRLVPCDAGGTISIFTLRCDKEMARIGQDVVRTNRDLPPSLSSSSYYAPNGNFRPRTRLY